jgi:hypothetical protein
MSSKAQFKFISAQRRKEQWEYKNYRENGISSMIDIFQAKGMSRADAEVVVHKMAEYENFFVSLMMTEEKGLVIPDETETELFTDSGLMFLAYAVFGTLPFVVFFIAVSLGSSHSISYLAALLFDLCLVLTLGCIKSSFR